MIVSRRDKCRNVCRFPLKVVSWFRIPKEVWTASLRIAFSPEARNTYALCAHVNVIYRTYSRWHEWNLLIIISDRFNRPGLDSMKRNCKLLSLQSYFTLHVRFNPLIIFESFNLFLFYKKKIVVISKIKVTVTEKVADFDEVPTLEPWLNALGISFSRY